jgi:hypothetical protein
MALAGPGGTNKSTWLLQLGVAIATGRSDIAGLPMREPKKVWVWNQEDDADELRRRLAAIMLQFNVSFDDLGDRLYLDSGVEHPFMFARKMGDNTIKQTGDVAATIKWVSDNGIEALLLDPLAELHEANEVDNTQMRMVLGQARRIAVEADCAVGIAAHTPKRSRANIDELVGDVAALRGGGSQGGLTRMVYTMLPMSDKMAKGYALPPEAKASHFVRLDGAKNNLARCDDEPWWFRRESKFVGSFEAGEEIVVLTPIKLQKHMNAFETDALAVMARAIGHLPPAQWHKFSAIEQHMTEDEGSCSQAKRTSRAKSKSYLTVATARSSMAGR